MKLIYLGGPKHGDIEDRELTYHGRTIEVAELIPQRVGFSLGNLEMPTTTLVRTVSYRPTLIDNPMLRAWGRKADIHIAFDERGPGPNSEFQDRLLKQKAACDEALAAIGDFLEITRTLMPETSSLALRLLAERAHRALEKYEDVKYV